MHQIAAQGQPSNAIRAKMALTVAAQCWFVIATLGMFAAEVATGLWLIFKGIDLDSWKRQTAATTMETGS